jgi:hypothetical protein
MPEADPQRYHLTLTIDGQPAMHGWGGKRATAERKYKGWIGEHGSIAGARITLADTDGRELAAWP